jgi:hypothetical protein
MVIAVSLAISLTFSATMIWARFLYVETYVETVDDRYRKVTDRLIIRVEKLEESNINNHGE